MNDTLYNKGENNDTSLELEELKRDLQDFKVILNEQEIINEQMIRKIVTKNARGIQREARILTIAGFITIPIVICGMVYLHHSLFFILATTFYLLYAIAANIIFHHPLKDNFFLGKDLATVCNIMHKYKKRDFYWIVLNLPLLAGWFGWFCYELIQSFGFQEAWYLCIAGVVGGIVGGIIGLTQRRRRLRMVDEIIRQIEQE